MPLRNSATISIQRSVVVLNENVAESSGNRRQKLNGHDGDLTRPAAIPHVGKHDGIAISKKTTTPAALPLRKGQKLFRTVESATFTLPTPALRNFRPPLQPGVDQGAQKHAETTQSPPRARRNSIFQYPAPFVACARKAKGSQSVYGQKILKKTHSPAQNPSHSYQAKTPTATKPIAPTDVPTTQDDQATNSSRVKTGHSDTSTVKTQKTPYITTEPAYPAGRTWRPFPVKPIPISPLPPSFLKNKQIHQFWVAVHETPFMDVAWDAYRGLDDHDISPPLAVLHRLVRLVVQQRPRATKEYTRLLELLKRIRVDGGNVNLHEWNALIDAAGRGLRKTSVRHYEMALSFFRDMTKGRKPGATLDLEAGHRQDVDEKTLAPVEPDIYTYTTLLGIAARTRDAKCLRHARMLLERSGIPPNRVTHLALMTYFSDSGQTGGVRSTLLMLARENMQLGLDGINALLMAYSRNRRLDVVTMVYRLLKHNLSPNLDNAEEESERLEEYRRLLRTEEFIVVPDHIIPNEITYTTVIQTMAYHGHLSSALVIFTDMLTTLNTERGAPLVADPSTSELKPSPYRPTASIYRALFLGFRRHAFRGTPVSKSTSDWTLDNLKVILNLFVGMPSDIQVGSTSIYWLLTAFRKASGDDVELVRDVWKRLEARYKVSLGGKDNRLRRIVMWLFPEDVKRQ
ncbi:hypothetical protein H0H93_000286 [Arthromyces matolae]|nr:hypothetical protein H0H93_000286 [Arthromyces matolae]